MADSYIGVGALKPADFTTSFRNSESRDSRPRPLRARQREAKPLHDE